MPFRFIIDVPIRSDWSNIDLLVTSVRTCFAAMLPEQEGSHTVAMVAGELLENAVKYGDWRGAQRTFRFHVSGDGARAIVRVDNPVSDPARALAAVQAVLARIAEFPTAEAAYHARLVEVAESAAPGTSQLGLARIAYQAGCALHAEVDGKSLSVVAELTL